MGGLWCGILIFLICHLSVHTCGSSRARESSLLDADVPTSFPTASYEQGVLGKEWWYVVQATIMFTGNVDDNPNDAADYALTFTLQDRLRDMPEVSAEVLEVDILRTPISRDQVETFQRRYARIWCLSRGTAQEVVNVLEYINDNPIIMVIPMHEMDFTEITSLSIMDSAIITSTEEPPYTTVHTLSPIRIIFVIAGTITLFYLGVKIIGKLWAYKKEHFSHMRDPYDMLCGCARWIIAMLEAAENENRGYIRSSMDSSMRNGVAGNAHDNDESDDEEGSHKFDRGRNDFGNDLQSPYIVESDAPDRHTATIRYDNDSMSDMKGKGFDIAESEVQGGNDEMGVAFSCDSSASPAVANPLREANAAND